MSEAKWVHPFGGNAAEALGGTERDLVGAKGAALAEMAALGLPVPPGFTISTAACSWFTTNGGRFPPGLAAQMEEELKHLAERWGRDFGGERGPLLLAVRPSAPAALPGIAATVLNLGLNDETVQALARESGDAAFAWDCFRRFIAAFGETVLGLDGEGFDEILETEEARLGLEGRSAFSADHWRGVVGLFQAHVEAETGEPFPQDPRAQLHAAVAAVFASWTGARATAFRRLHDMPDEPGLGVCVQAMVFGNAGGASAAGTASTRDPATGEKGLYGEYLPDAQGSDLATGVCAPQSLSEQARLAVRSALPSLEGLMPDAFAALGEAANTLERHFRHVPDIEFTIECGRLWLLQAGEAKQTPRVALRVAADMARDGVIGREEAVLRIDPASLDAFLHPTVEPDPGREAIAVGLPASPGAATGAIVFAAQAALEAKAAGRKVILVRAETSPEDIGGMHAAEGVLTARGGMTSHAAVVARGMGKPCVSGAGGVRIDAREGFLLAGGRRLQAGDTITIDGSTGQVLEGAVPVRAPELSGDLAEIMAWADAHRRMAVRANADTPRDARAALSFGAEGIGLCRTEHMFFEEARIVAVREMILAETEAGRRAALDKLLPVQRADFTELFVLMAGRPVTVRLLDPPLHEFLPRTEAGIAEVAAALGMPVERLRARVEMLGEFNPMLGHRGCRLAISFPEIVETQARAILEAAQEAGRRTGKPVVPEIMVPLVGMKRELDFVRARIDAVARAVAAESGSGTDYLVGTMIELPRAALRAGDIAQAAEFFSFGTNDLTQTTFGISRDDAAGFLEAYRKRGIVDQDPFVALDMEGVGELMQLAAERGRQARSDIKLGICGEHGGHPASIAFCEALELDYVSCSPFRVPAARLAAAQAAIRRRRNA